MYRSLEQTKIAVIGLGYVGLLQARLFSTKFRTVGFDLNQACVDGMVNGRDTTLAHDQFKDMDIRSLVREGGVVFDVKGILDRNIIDGRL